MVEYGQYPLILQKDTRNGVLVPVGLAEASSLTFQSLSATTISATSYANLPVFGGNFTGIQTVCAVGVCGSPILHSVVNGNILNLKNIYFNLGNFVSVTAGADITISYNQPLAAIRGGTGSQGGNEGEIPYWNPTGGLTTDPNLIYDGGFLLAPKVDTPGGGGYYVDGNPFDLGNLASVNLGTPPTHDQVLTYTTGTGKWIAKDQTGGAALPNDPCAIIFNNSAGDPSTDPGDLTYHGNTIRFPTAVAANSITSPTFIENGVALSTKYQVADATLCALGDVTPGANQFLYFTAPTTAAAAIITSDARGLLDDGTYADMRNTLGLGTLATKSVIVLDSADVCNTLPITKGGTGSTSLTTGNGIVYSNGAVLTQITAPTGSNKLLKWDGGSFTWANSPTGTFTSPTDPCAIVFVNNDGTGIISSPNLKFDAANGNLINNQGDFQTVGDVLAQGDIATTVGNVYGGNVASLGVIYEGGILAANLLSNKYQGKDPTLTTLASMNTAADVLLYFSATDGAASTTLTNSARQLLDDSSFATMRTTLQLGTVATKNAIALNSADVCNTLPVTNGGTGKTTLTSNSLLFGNGTASISEVAAPTTNNTFLKWNSGFSWATPSEQWTHVFKTANQKINSTSYTNDSALAATTVNGNNYIIKYSIYFSANPINGISTQVNISPGYQTFTYRINYIPPGNIVDSMVKAGATDEFDYQGSVPSNGAGYLELDCVIVDVKDTSVPIQFKLTSSGGSDELFILKGSHLKYTTF